MTRVTIEIEVVPGNPAFEDDEHEGKEVARILRCLASQYELNGIDICKPLLDINGQNVGSADTFDEMGDILKIPPPTNERLKAVT